MRPRDAVVAILLAAALWTSLPRMARLTREAVELLPLSYEQRRERKLGPYYASLRRIATQLQPGEAVGLSTRDLEDDISGAVFANYYLYPRPTRLFASLDAYRVNAFDPAHPKKLVRIDLRRTAEARLMSYLEVRAEEVAESRIVRDPRPGAEAHREFIVPIAIAIDGQPGSAWLTEGVIVSDAEASVTLTFFPSGETKTFALRAQEPLILGDAVYAITSRLETGWIRTSATSPVRAAFWFVNRGLRHAEPLPLFASLPPLPQRVAGGERLWILNPSDRSIDVFVNGEKHTVDAHALAALASARQNEIAADQPVLAFSAGRVNGREEFHWPSP